MYDPEYAVNLECCGRYTIPALRKVSNDIVLVSADLLHDGILPDNTSHVDAAVSAYPDVRDCMCPLAACVCGLRLIVFGWPCAGDAASLSRGWRVAHGECWWVRSTVSAVLDSVGALGGCASREAKRRV